MSEWSKVPVLKTGVSKDTGGSNPSRSVPKTKVFRNLEAW